MVEGISKFLSAEFPSYLTLSREIFKKIFMAPFYRWGSTTSQLVPLQGGSLLFTTKFPDITGTQFINLRRMKD